MAQIRTLKLNLLADVTKFGAGMVAAQGDVNKLSTATQRAGKRVAAAFTGMGIAAGYAAIRIGKESVDAAIEDEKSQKQLALALKNTTKATNATIASTETWISKQQFATGISDSKLRPALANLARATGDLTQAQKLTTLAQDISIGTNRDLESVSIALAKAYNGNLGALTRLGIPLDENIKKTKDFDAATVVLQKTFGGAAAANADTYAGKLAIVNERISELKESAGTSLLGVLGKLLSTVNDVAIGFAGGTGSLASSMAAVTREGYYSNKGENLGSAMKNVSDSMAKLFGVLKTDGTNSASILDVLTKALNLYADALDAVATNAARTKKYAGWLFSGGVLGSIGRGVMGSRATGGTVSAGQAYRVGEFGPETLIMGGASGRIVPNAGGGNVTVNINGVIDAESARRSIEKLLQDSARRTGAVSLIGATL